MRGVRSLMRIQRGCQSETLTAYVALERSFTRVAVDMRFQIPLWLKPLPQNSHLYMRTSECVLMW